MSWKIDVKVSTRNGIYTGLDIKRSDEQDSYGFDTPLDGNHNPDWNRKAKKDKKKVK